MFDLRTSVESRIRNVISPLRRFLQPDRFQITKIGKWDWKTLIILDSCRYDYFERQYRNHLEGKLEKGISSASSTVEWLLKVFPDWYDLTYISAIPGINSLGVKFTQARSYNAREHFRKIVDVWDFGWSDELGTVHPKEVNKAVKKLNIKTRQIIHFVQPHQPYIGKTKIAFHFDKPMGGIKHAGELIKKLIERGELSLKEIRHAYKNNLELVLGYVSDLITDLKGKIVVTADHGELLEEGGKLWHFAGLNLPKLREIPWLEISRA